jgi:plasmid stabilization system protein ParE
VSDHATFDDSGSAPTHLVGSHTLFYRMVAGDAIDVVRILHRRRDIDRHL